MKYLDTMSFKGIKKTALPALLALLSSLWILPFVVAITFFLSAEYSKFEQQSRNFEFIKNTIGILGVLWFYLAWLLWSFVLIKQFQGVHEFHLKNSPDLTRIRLLSVLSIFWILLLYVFSFMYCTAKMQIDNHNYISSGAHVFSMIRSGLGWASLLLSIVLYKLFVGIFRTMQKREER